MHERQILTQKFQGWAQDETWAGIWESLTRQSTRADETRQQLNVSVAEREWKPLPQSERWPGGEEGGGAWG